MVEEALIRAIVEGVGDDFPRGVYADWLEERGDPRAEYLRMEMEWARPWREGVRPEVPAALWEMADRLDAQWVARVSRPPLGVCCEHLRFEKGGPRLTLDDVRAAERLCGVAFPPEYVALLLNYNGGEPVPNGAWSRPAADRRDWFFPVGGQPGTRHQSLQQAIEQHRGWVSRFTAAAGDAARGLGWYADFLPICQTDGGYFQALIGTRGSYCGRVVLIDLTDNAVPYPPLGVEFGSLEGYLARLLPSVKDDDVLL